MSNEQLLDVPPARAVSATGAVAYGRYRRPIPWPNVAAAGPLGRFRLKEWHYTSLVTDELFVAFGLVQLGYLANAFCYVVERADPGRSWQYEAMAPLGGGLRFASSSVGGVTSWRHGRAAIDAGWGGVWSVSLDLVVGGERLAGGFRFGALRGQRECESLALLFELGADRPAYTHKVAALRAEGRLWWRGRWHPVDGGLAALDWTRSVARRETRWKWASLSARDRGGRTVGLNLSAEVYDDADGDSQENAVWLDGRATTLGGVTFALPADPLAEAWRVRSLRGDEVELGFRPLGARRQALDLGLLRSDFVQPYGLFTGRLRPAGGPAVELVDAFGVVEDHLALW
jgi:hypothetical protein